MGNIEKVQIEQMYCFLDLLSMKMTDLEHNFLREFGWVAKKATHCSFKRCCQNTTETYNIKLTILTSWPLPFPF